MPRFENTDVHTRVWNHLVNAETERTLELAPGEDAEVDVPDDYVDAWLKPVKASKAKRSTEPSAGATDHVDSASADEPKE